MKAIHESMAKGEFLTGLLYINPTQPPLPEVLNLVDQPLATLTEAQVKPSPAVLEEIMQGLM
jgi:2-oxoglutarate ferredoxin oxidoreductase subunit beta